MALWVTSAKNVEGELAKQILPQAHGSAQLSRERAS